jgi:hypothetical protein
MEAPTPFSLVRGKAGAEPISFPQSQSLREAPPNRLLSGYIRLIKTDVGCLSTQTHQDMSFPSQAALGTRGPETPPVSGLGGGSHTPGKSWGSTPPSRRAEPGVWDAVGRGGVGGLPCPPPDPHPPRPLGAAGDRWGGEVLLLLQVAVPPPLRATVYAAAPARSPRRRGAAPALPRPPCGAPSGCVASVRRSTHRSPRRFLPWDTEVPCTPNSVPRNLGPQSSAP